MESAPGGGAQSGGAEGGRSATQGNQPRRRDLRLHNREDWIAFALGQNDEKTRPSTVQKGVFIEACGAGDYSELFYQFPADELTQAAQVQVDEPVTKTSLALIDKKFSVLMAKLKTVERTKELSHVHPLLNSILESALSIVPQRLNLKVERDMFKRERLRIVNRHNGIRNDARIEDRDSDDILVVCEYKLGRITTGNGGQLSLSHRGCRAVAQIAAAYLTREESWTQLRGGHRLWGIIGDCSSLIFVALEQASNAQQPFKVLVSPPITFSRQSHRQGQFLPQFDQVQQIVAWLHVAIGGIPALASTELSTQNAFREQIRIELEIRQYVPQPVPPSNNSADVRGGGDRTPSRDNRSSPGGAMGNLHLFLVSLLPLSMPHKVEAATTFAVRLTANSLQRFVIPALLAMLAALWTLCSATAQWAGRRLIPLYTAG